MSIEIRLPFYSYPVYEHNDEPSLTRQSEMESCDINNILHQFQATGTFGSVNVLEPRYGDASAPDFQTALNLVLKAQESFNSLDASIRSRFGNDVNSFMSFVDNPENFDEGVRLGIFNPAQPKTPASAGVEGESGDKA